MRDTRSGADRLLRWLVRLLPSELRADHGREIAQVFRDERRDHRASGRLSRLTLWLRTIAGLLRLAVLSHAAALKQDVGYALRTLRRAPIFTVVALTTLGLGIGAATSMFSVVDAVLLRPLPYTDGARLVMMQERKIKNPTEGAFGVSYPNFLDVRARTQTLTSAAAYRFDEVILRGGSEPVREFGAFVSPEFFATLDAQPELGRTFATEENRPGTRAIILSHDLWQRLLGGNPQLNERSLMVGNVAMTVVGVMPPGFGFPTSETKIWLPLGLVTADPAMQDRTVHMTSVVGRLRAGATLEQARVEIAGIAASVSDPGHTATVTPLANVIVGKSEQPLILATAVIGLVLLLACVNTAGLLLARAAARRRETAIRVAIGASRSRLIRQHLTESLVLALAGGVAGVTVSALCLGLVRTAVAAMVPRAEGIVFDSRALVFALAVSIVTSVVFGLVPALASTRPDVSGGLKGTQRERRLQLRATLVVIEMALSLLLVVGAGLLAKSYWRVVNVDPGFDSRGLVTLRVSAPSSRYPDVPSIVRFYRELPGRLTGIAGVDAVSAVNTAPISGGDSHGVVTVDGQVIAPADAPVASFRRILPNYFRTMRIPILEGREFDARDQGQDPMVVIISHAMARRLWPTSSPIGARIKIGPADREPWLTVVGVAGDVRNVGVEDEVAFDTYEPHAQRPWSTMRLLVRANADPSRVASDVRARLRDVEPDLIVDQMDTMDSRISTSEAARRFSTVLLAALAGLALVLAAISLYGLTAYSVSARTREFGVRLVLGATPGDVGRQVVGQSVRLGIAGLVIGVAAAAPAARALRAQLAGVEPGDPVVFGAVACILLVVTLVAAYAPARRATRLDPNTILRVD